MPITLAIVVRYLVFVPVRVFVQAEPEQFFADTGSTVSVTVREHNRLGFRTPLRRAALRCQFEEGAELGIVEYLEDSTIARLRSTGLPGIIPLRITSAASLFPMNFRIEAQPLFVAGGEEVFRVRITHSITMPFINQGERCGTS